MAKKVTAKEELVERAAALEPTVAEARKQVERLVEGGIKGAGRHARKALQDLKDNALAMRKLVIEIRNEGKE